MDATRSRSAFARLGGSPGRRPQRGRAALAHQAGAHTRVLALCATLALVACGQPSAPTARAPAAVPAGPAAAPGPAAPVPPVRQALTLSYSALVASQSPLWIAQETGIYDRHGIDMNLTYISPVQQTIAAILSGEVDVGIVGGTGVIMANLQGSDLATFAGTKNQLAGRIMARADIRDLADLKGKRVGMTRHGGNSHYMGLVALDRHGMQPDRDVIWIAAGGTPEILAALTAGSLDAGVMVSPGDFVAESRGFRSILDMTPLAIPYTATQSSARRPVLANKQEAVWRYVQALADAVQLYKSDRDLALRIIGQYTSMDDRAALENAYEIERAIMADDLRPDLRGVQAAMDELASDEPRVRDTRPEDYVDFRLVDRLAAERP